jgi:hypothetical protein
LKKEVSQLKLQIKANDEILDLKQILLDKQKKEIEDVMSINQHLNVEIDDVKYKMKRLVEENIEIKNELQHQKDKNNTDHKDLMKLL